MTETLLQSVGALMRDALVPLKSSLASLTDVTTVATLADRDAIPAANRSNGMAVQVTATGEVFLLGAGLTNTDWTPWLAAGSSNAAVDEITLWVKPGESVAVGDIVMNCPIVADASGTVIDASLMNYVEVIRPYKSKIYEGGVWTKKELPSVIKGVALTACSATATDRSVTVRIAGLTSVTLSSPATMVSLGTQCFCTGRSVFMPYYAPSGQANLTGTLLQAGDAATNTPELTLHSGFIYLARLEGITAPTDTSTRAVVSIGHRL